MEEGELDDKMSFAIPAIRKIETLCREFSLDRSQLALVYLKIKYPDQKVIFGVDSAEQVKINVNIWNELIENKRLINQIETSFNDIDTMILNPSLWPK